MPKPTATPAGGKRAPRRAGPRREKRLVPQGQVHIQSTFNNTIVTVTDLQGNTIAWTSTGGAGFKGSRKSTPYAAQLAATQAAKSAMDMGMREADVFIEGSWAGPRVRGSLAAGCRAARALDHRHHAHPAQRLPAAQEAPRLAYLLERQPRSKTPRRSHLAGCTLGNWEGEEGCQAVNLSSWFLPTRSGAIKSQRL